jgi:hypothetical protein
MGSEIDIKTYLEKLIRTFGGDPNNMIIHPWMYENRKAASSFDKENGTSVSKQYNIPLSLSSDQLWVLILISDKLLPESDLKRILHDEIYLKLVETYPKLKLDKDWKDVLMGVASEYNEDDIREYIIVGGGLKRSKEYMDYYKKFQNKTGKELLWIPSVRTLHTLYKHFGIQ